METDADAIHYAQTRYGFEYGSLVVERLTGDGKKGWVVVSVRTPKAEVQLYATRTGLLRVLPLTKLAKEAAGGD